MSTTTDLLDRFKAARNLASDADAARALRVKPATISNYRQGIRHAQPETAKAMAMAIGERPEPWVLRIQADRETNDESRRVWTEMARNLARAAVFCLAVYTAISTTGAMASTDNAPPSQRVGNSAGLYIM